ncbi:Lysine-specific permease [Fusarium odoratissimum]|uniref:Lysine-specific permease n=1 Tax=Fusarium oxysporum f. sp. cubense (strain race 4) TaxID=2502994 RepID=N1S3I7_FUSC4|nr:Lysine-specific permease [Fusarium odoratissimum]
MFRDASIHSLIPTTLLLLCLDAGYVLAASEGSGLDRCPDYVANHAPLVWLHPEDRFMPSDLSAHIVNTIPKLNEQPISGPSSIDLSNLGELNSYGGEDVALTAKEDPLTYPTWILGEAPDASGRIANSVPCAVILVEKSEVDIDAFYFYFYSFNEGPNITQVMEPINHLVGDENLSSGMHFGNHVGDWEHNMVRFHNGTPVGVYYSQHVDGVGFKWDDSTVNITDGRPIVYSALGSHANYPQRGHQIHNAAMFDYCDEGKLWNPSRKTIPSAMRWTFWGVFSIFIATVFFLGLNIPSTNKDLLSESQDASASPLVIVAQLAGVPVLPSILNAVLLTAVLTAANSDVYSSSRILISLADSGHAPAFLKKTNRFGTPYNAVGVCAAVGFLSFLNLSNDGTVVFNWFLSITSVAGFIAWAIISLCHIRFMKALSLQGISRSELPYVAPLQPYLSWYGLFFSVLIIITSGFQVFIEWDTSSFFTAYISLILFIVMFVGHKLIFRTKLVPLNLFPNNFKIPKDTRPYDMFRDASIHSLIPTTLLLLCLDAGYVLAASEGSGLDRCPDYVANHAPLVWLHPEDRFMPSDLSAHIVNTIPKLNEQPISGPSSIDLSNLGELNSYGGEDVALTAKEDPLTYPTWILGEAPDASGRIANSVPCAVILVEKSEVDIDAFYFYFYSFNEGPNITQVMEPINHLVGDENLSSGMHFGNHVGDWEHNMVRFHNGTPVGVYYSQHVDGVGFKWDDSTVNITDGRPIVYSALGSHANYPQRGHQIHNAAMFDYCDEGKLWNPAQSAYYYRFNPDSFTVTPIISPFEPSATEPAQNYTSWFDFTGHWGDISYPDSDPRQETVPHFGLKRFNSGPNGPRFKHLIRKGLVRDHARKMGWKEEWAVGVFMYWYPCCIRGWRLWRSLGIMAVMMSAFVLAVVYGVRRLKTWRQRRVYTKLKNDDIPMEELRREEEFLIGSDDEEDDHRR